jgi:hypothetical protein
VTSRYPQMSLTLQIHGLRRAANDRFVSCNSYSQLVRQFWRAQDRRGQIASGRSTCKRSTRPPRAIDVKSSCSAASPLAKRSFFTYMLRCSAVPSAGFL